MTERKFHLSDTTRHCYDLLWLTHQLVRAKRAGDTARVDKLKAQLKRIQEAA